MANTIRSIPVYKRVYWPHPNYLEAVRKGYACLNRRGRKFGILPFIDLVVSYKYEVTGYQNPAICALAAIKAMDLGLPIDEESFERAAETFEGPVEGGMLVRTIEDVYKLADIGNFTIVFNDGKLTAVPILGRIKV